MFTHQPREMFEGPVKGLLGVCVKTAGRQLPRSQMIGDAFTADTFPRAWFITAVALFEILFLFAFHTFFLSFNSVKYINPTHFSNDFGTWARVIASKMQRDKTDERPIFIIF